MGVHGIHQELVKLFGRLKYRSSFAQNVLIHSLEVSFLCGIMAAELGLNVKMAKRAGLLHDIGKAVDHEIEGSHAVIGADMARKYGEPPEIVHAIARLVLEEHYGEAERRALASLVSDERVTSAREALEADGKLRAARRIRDFEAWQESLGDPEFEPAAVADDRVNTGYFGGIAIMGYDSVSYFTEARAVKGSPLACRLPDRLGRIEFVSYGLVVHLLLLPTPPRGDAVTIGYRLVTSTWRGLSPHKSNVITGAQASDESRRYLTHSA